MGGGLRNFVNKYICVGQRTARVLVLRKDKITLYLLVHINMLHPSSDNLVQYVCSLLTSARTGQYTIPTVTIVMDYR